MGQTFTPPLHLRKLLLTLVAITAFLIPDLSFGQGAVMWSTATASSSGTYLTGTTSRRNQCFYPAGELTGAVSGTITKIYFRRNSVTSGTMSLANFRVLMGQTSGNAIPNSTFLTGLTQVYIANPATQAAGAAATWISFTLDTPFSYNAAQGLIIETEYTGSPTNGINVTSTSASTPLRRLTSAGNATLPYSAVATGTTSGFIPAFSFDVSSVLRDLQPISIVGSPALSSLLCSGGSTTLSTNIQNNGSSTVTSLKFKWFINGVDQGTISVNSLSMATGASTNVNLGNYNLPVSFPRSFQLSVQITEVNGSTDQETSNDIKTDNYASGLSGSYTVGAGGNFTTITAAIDAINANGLCGQTTLNILPGTYTGQYQINTIVGASPSNRLTIKPNSGTVTLAFDANTTGNNYILALNGADYVTIQGLTFDRSNAVAAPTQSRCLDISGGSDFAIVTANTFNGFNYGSGTATNLTASIFSNTSTDLTTTITNNTLNLNGQGIFLTGAGVAVSEGGHVITGNNINMLVNGIHCATFAGGVTISNNTINRYDQVASATTATGIYMITLGDKLIVNNNVINLYTTGTGIFLSASPGLVGDRSQVFNNTFSLGGSGTSYGLWTLSSLANIDIVFNNFRVAGTSVTPANNVGWNHTGTGSGISVRNNNFFVTGTNGYAVSISTTTTGNAITSASNNNVYSETANYAFYGSAVSNLALLNSASSDKFVSSVSVDPNYTSATDLHIGNSSLAFSGVPITGITKDIDGQDRDAVNPTIGADELFPVLRDISPTAVNTNVQTICGAASTAVSFTVINAGLNTITSFTATYYRIQNGVTGSAVQQTFSSISLATGAEGTYSFTTPWSYTPNNYYQIRVDLSLPNGGTDQNTANDTRLSSTERPGYSGTITLNPSLAATSFNFINVQSALDSIQLRGLCGQVTLNISNGTYNGQFEFGNIPNASADNRLTIKPASGTVTLAFDAGFSGSNYILLMNGADYVTIQGIVFNRSVSAGVPTLSRCIDASNGTDYLILDGCTFLGYDYAAAATTNLTASVYSNVSIDLATTITGCTFSYNGIGVSLNALTGVNEGGHVLTNNTVNSWVYGFFIGALAGGVTITDNIITRSDQVVVPTNFYGIWLTDADGKLVVLRNKVTGNAGGNGIYISNSNGIPADRSVVANNQLSMVGGAGTTYGIYTLGTTSDLGLFYNNVLVNSSTVTATGNVAWYNLVTAGTGTLAVRNNNFTVAGTNGYAVYLNSATATTVFSSCSHNNLFSQTANFAWYLGAMADLTALNAASSNLFAPGQSVSPSFTSNTNLTSTNLALALSATPITGITTDIAGLTRNVTIPTIGANELFPPTDDAGVTAISPGLNAICNNGNSTMTITVENQGLATLSSVTATYFVTVNGVEGTGVTQAFSGLSIAPGGSGQVAFTTPWSHTFGSYYQFRVVTSLPNNTVDANAANNTLRSVTYRPAYKNTITVNPASAITATNFQSLQAAYDSLNVAGICGNTTLSISTGTYTGKVQLRDVPGTSSSSILTITGAGTTADQTIITAPAATTAGTNWAMSGLGIAYVNIQKLTFRRTGDSLNNFAICLDLSGGVSNVVVDNCRFLSTNYNVTGVSGATAGVFSGATNVDSDVTIQNSFFTGSVTSIHWAGSSALIPDLGIRILNNTINTMSYGIYLLSCSNPEVVGNNIRRVYQTKTNVIAYGVYMITGANGSDLERNQIRFYGGTCYGYYYTNQAGTALNPNLFINNYIYSDGSGANYQMYISSTSHFIKAYHNTFVCNTSGAGYGVYGISSTATNLEFNNNIFANTNAAGSTTYPFYQSPSGLVNIVSATNNTIYCAKPNFYSFFGAIQVDAAAFIAAGGGRTNGTTDINPLFTPTDGYQFSNPALDGTGLLTLGITTDIEGNVRTGALDNGAYEFTPPARDVQINALASEHSCASGNQPVKVTITSLGTSTLTSVKINWSVNGVPQTLATITGLSLASGESQEVTLGNFTFAAGAFTIDASVNQVNNSTDQNTSNDAMATANVSTVGNSALALPYTLDLESTTVTTGVPTFWAINPDVATASYRWNVAEGPQGSASSGPNVDNTLGTGAGNYIYTVAASGISGSVATFTTECINLGSVNNPALRFFYHRYGTGTPVLHVDVYSNGSWINSVFTMTGADPQQTLETSAWKQVTVPLGTYTGIIKLRFRAIRGVNTLGETALDDIRIFDGSASDLTTTAIVRVNTACPTNGETIAVTVQNLSSNAHNFALRPATFILTGTGPVAVSQTVVRNSGILPANSSATYNLFAGINGTAAGTYSFTTTMTLAIGQDENPSNNNGAAPLVLINAGTQALPVFFNGGRFTGSNLATVSAGWSESKGVTSPNTGTISNWTSSTVFASDTSIRINLSLATDIEWLLLPRINATATTKLRFRSAITESATNGADATGFAGTDDFIQVRVSTDCGTSWTSIYTMSADWQTVNSVTNVFQPFMVDLSSYAGQQLIVAFFASEGSIDDVNTYDFHLDDIALTNNDFLTWTGGLSTLVSNKYNWVPWFAPQANWICNIPSGVSNVLAINANTTVGGMRMETAGRINFTGTPVLTILNDFSTASDVYTLSGDFALAANGTLPQLIGANGAPLSPVSLTINNPAGVTLTNPASIRNVLTLTNGVFNLNNFTLTMVSTNTGTARIAPVTGGSLSNASNFTFQRYIAPPAAVGSFGGGWYFIGTGVTGATVNTWANRTNYTAGTYQPTGTSQLWLYDNANNTVPADNGWVKPTSAGQVLPVGQGVRFYFQFYFWTQHSGVYFSKGMPHIGSYNFTSLLNFCTSGCAWQNNNGWSLIANPYASTIDWDSPSWTRSAAVANEVKIWLNGTANYASYVAGVGTLGGSRNLAAGQGFMVKAVSTITSNDLIATENVKTTSASYLREASLTQIMRINIKDAANHLDEAVVRLVPGATAGYDAAYDASYLEGTYLNVYTVPTAGNKLTINAMDLPTSTVTLPIGLKTTELGTHTMTFTGLSDWLGNYQVYLNDNFLGTSRPLVEGAIVNFNVTNAPATTGTGRFTLVMMPSTVTALPTLNANAIFVAYPNPAKSSEVRLVVSGMGAGKGTISVTNAIGKTIATQVVDLTGLADQSFGLNQNLAAGIYHVSLQAAGGHKTIKLVVE